MTEVKILNEHGAGTMGKPVGTYLTLEADALAKKDKSYHEEVSGRAGGTSAYPDPADDRETGNQNRTFWQ